MAMTMLQAYGHVPWHAKVSTGNLLTLGLAPESYIDKCRKEPCPVCDHNWTWSHFAHVELLGPYQESELFLICSQCARDLATVNGPFKPARDTRTRLQRFVSWILT